APDSEYPGSDRLPSCPSDRRARRPKRRTASGRPCRGQRGLGGKVHLARRACAGMVKAARRGHKVGAMTEQTAIYRRRAGRLSRGEREWRVEPDALVSRGASGRERRIPWADVVSVRVGFNAARGRPWRHLTELQPRHGAKIELDNAHFLAPGAYEDRSASYGPFVRAALARIGAANPNARAL